LRRSDRAFIGDVGKRGARRAKPHVKIETTQGVIVVELFPQSAPKTVENLFNMSRMDFMTGPFSTGSLKAS